MKKVECPHCKNLTFNTPYCGVCGEPMYGETTKKDEQWLTKFGFGERAYQVAEDLWGIEVARFETVRLARRSPQTIAVAPQAGAYVFSSAHPEPLRLGPGTYSVADLSVGKRQGARLACVCHVSELPINATFVFPDELSLGEFGLVGATEDDPDVKPGSKAWREQMKQILAKGDTAVDAALKTLSLRTSDNLLGGARVQMSLICDNPARLIVHFRDEHIRDQRKQIKEKAVLSKEEVRKHEELRKLEELREQNAPEWLLERMKELLAKEERDDRREQLVSLGIVLIVTALALTLLALGLVALAGVAGLVVLALYPFLGFLQKLLLGPKKGVDTSLVEPSSLTLWRLYPRFGLELATVLRASIRNTTAQDLYDTVDVRERVQQDIERNMAATFATLGLRIVSVSAFQFLSPAYEQLLEERGKVALRRQELEDIRETAAVDAARRAIVHEDFLKASTVESTKDRHQLDEAAATKEKEDQYSAEELRRRLEREAAQRDFDRQQRAADERLSNALQSEKLQQALALQQQMQDAQARRQLEMAEAYAKLPPEQLLTFALMQNPQLAGAFAAAQQALALQDRLTTERKFRDELATAYGKNNEQFTALLQEAARQLGNYAAKKAENEQRRLPESPPATPTPPTE